MTGLAIKDDYQGLAAAASLGITVLKRCKQNTWAELTAAMEAADPLAVKAFKLLDLTDEQLGLISSYQPELGLLRIAPSVIPVICPACTRYILTSDQAPTRCLVTPGCPGKPAKVAAAVNAKKSVEEAITADDVPELADLKANLDAAVETVDSLIEHISEGRKEDVAAEAEELPDAAVAEPDDDTDDVPPPPPAPRGPITLDDDNDFD